MGFVDLQRLSSALTLPWFTDSVDDNDLNGSFRVNPEKIARHIVRKMLGCLFREQSYLFHVRVFCSVSSTCVENFRHPLQILPLVWNRLRAFKRSSNEEEFSSSLAIRLTA
jgi:hypothetical protein